MEKMNQLDLNVSVVSLGSIFNSDVTGPMAASSLPGFTEFCGVSGQDSARVTTSRAWTPTRRTRNGANWRPCSASSAAKRWPLATSTRPRVSTWPGDTCRPTAISSTPPARTPPITSSTCCRSGSPSTTASSLRVLFSFPWHTSYIDKCVLVRACRLDHFFQFLDQWFLERANSSSNRVGLFSIFAGNWKALELAVRELASSRGHRFRLYTGGFDVLKLADVNGVQQPIHLAVDENGNAIIPVPKFFWKVGRSMLGSVRLG